MIYRPSQSVVSLVDFVWFALVLLFATGVSAGAGELPSSASSPASPGMPLQLPEMTVTATREAQPLFDVPQAVTTVDREAIERQAPSVLPDLLRGATGVFVQQTTPGQAAPIIRGLIGSSVLVLVDGMRLNSAFFRPAPNQYFALVDPYNVERIEVVRGPGSALYGSDAMGGVIQIFTPVPQFSSDHWQWRGQGLGEFGSADVSQVARFSFAGGKTDLALATVDDSDLRWRGVSRHRAQRNAQAKSANWWVVTTAKPFRRWCNHEQFRLVRPE